eukprot:scpid97230/ scgid6584/ 
MAEADLQEDVRPRPLDMEREGDGTDSDGSSSGNFSAASVSSGGSSPAPTHFFGIRRFGLKKTTLRRNQTMNVLKSVGVPEQLHEEDEEYRQTFGLGLSGGGCRSASYCAGVLQSILDSEQELDYLSSVSGGGYIASSYLDWKYREGGKDAPEWHKAYFGRMLDRITNAFARFEQDSMLGIRDVVVGLSKTILVLVFLSLLLLQVVSNVMLEYLRIVRGFSIGR